MRKSLSVIDPDTLITSQEISTTSEVDALLKENAPVAIGVSGGKDSCAAAIAFDEHLRRIGHRGPVILIHSNLGRVEWSDSGPTCVRLANYLGRELVTVRRAAGDMMDRWLSRWESSIRRYANLECVKIILPWSTPSMRFCTSELKTDIICRALIKRFPGQRIVSVSGVRRSESTARSKSPTAKEQAKLSSKTHNTSGVDLNAICTWTMADVFSYCAAKGFPMHEAYGKYGSSRVSCRFCIMGSADDLRVSAGVPDHSPLYLEMVQLEIESTFAFQGGKWLGDVAPHLLAPAMTAALAAAKIKAGQREKIEAAIPKHLLYTKGWPTCMPTVNEAFMLADVRRRIGDLLGIEVGFTNWMDIRNRYEQLMEANARKRAA